MIVSHRFRCIFIKTVKTAGTSIEVFLARHCGPDDIVTPIIPPLPGHEPRNHEGFRNHMPAHAVRSAVGPEVWNSYRTFCVERNPWDKVLSHFHMLRARGECGPSLDDYLRKGALPFNLPKYTEPGDESAVIVDEVLRYESLGTGLAGVFGALGIPFDGDLGVRAKGEYRTDRRHYREVYSPAQAERVRQAFAPEIRLHGYSY